MPRGPVRTEQQLRNDLAKLIGEHGGNPLSISEYEHFSNGRGFASVSTYRTKFGSWENAVRAALMPSQSPTEPPVEKPPEQPIEQPAPVQVKTPSRTGAVIWKETPKEERAKQLAEQRAQAEANGTSREVKLVNLFGVKVIFGREATSSSTKSLDPEGEARICKSELKPVRDGIDNTNGVLRLVGGTLLRHRDLVVKVLKDNQLEDFPPERPRTFYLVSEPVALALLSTGRKDLFYPCAYGSGGNGTIICREIVIP